MSKITRVEIHAFTFEKENLGLGKHAAAGVGNLIYQRGGKLKTQRIAVRILCDDGAQGEYVTHWVGTPAKGLPNPAGNARLRPPRVSQMPARRNTRLHELLIHMVHSGLG